MCVCVKECARTHNYIFPVACSDAFYRPHHKAVLAKDLVCTSDTVPQLFESDNERGRDRVCEHMQYMIIYTII